MGPNDGSQNLHAHNHGSAGGIRLSHRATESMSQNSQSLSRFSDNHSEGANIKKDKGVGKK